MHFKRKDTWFNSGGRLERTIQFIIVYGYFPGATLRRSFPDFLHWMKSAVNCCCFALERIDLIFFRTWTIQPIECVLYIALSEQCSPEIYQHTLQCLIHQRCSDDFDPQDRQDSEMLLGFMFISGGQKIDQALETFARRLNMHSLETLDKREEMRSWIAEIRASNKGTHEYGNYLLDRYRFYDSQASKGAFPYLTSKYLLSEFKLLKHPGSLLGERVQAVERVQAIETSYCYKLLMDATLASLLGAASMLFFSLTLRLLSEACELNAEYGMALKALKKALRICFMRNGQHITPTFVKKECRERRNVLEAKMKNMRCGYCARTQSSKLRSCTGCMKIMYCDKRCQKKHWNVEHHGLCDRTWSVHKRYQELSAGLRSVFGAR